MTGVELLALPMREDNEAEASTVKDYFRSLLVTLFEEGDDFSAKRPFGNSGWEEELFVAFVDAGVLEAEIDEDGYLDDYNPSDAYDLVYEALEAL
jgi:hypothetical protein